MSEVEREEILFLISAYIVVNYGQPKTFREVAISFEQEQYAALEIHDRASAVEIRRAIVLGE